MAKDMARIENGVVVNIESWDESKQETSSLKNTGDLRVMTGDTYRNGRFYRDGHEIGDPGNDEAQDLIEALGAAAEALYEADLASIAE